MKATEEEMLKWEPQINATLRGYIGNAAQRDDLAQELHLTLIKALEGYDSGKGASFHTYLFCSLQNKLKTFLHRSNKDCYVYPIEDYPNLQESTVEENFSCELIKADLTTGEMMVLDFLLCGYNIREIGEMCQDEKMPSRLLKRIRRKTMYMKEGA